MKKYFSHKKTILTAVLIIALICAALAGCAETAISGTASSSPTDVPADAATPTPTQAPKVGLDAVFGKQQITIAAITDGTEKESALFLAGAQAEADSLGITLDAAATGNNFETAVSGADGNVDAIIACIVKPQTSYNALNNVSVPLTVFETGKGNIAQGVSHIYYMPENEVSMAFDAAMTYPPHDTPVRLILMFESKESESYKQYEKLYGEGKIFPKEIYIASEEKTAAGEWLKSKLGGYIAGMLDGVYAGNTDLALSALDTIEELKRTDMEVFCPGVTADTVDRMQKNPDVFVQSVGPNMYVAGALSVRAALKQIKGEESVTMELQPIVINAADLETSGVQALTELYGEAGKAWNEAWMDELREYYKGKIAG